MMNKVIIIAFALAITAYATCPNALGTAKTITQESAEVTLGGTQLACASLNSGAVSCCTKATVDAFKTTSDNLVIALENAAGTKDGLILAARKKVALLRTQFIALAAAYTTAVKTKLTTLTTGGNTVAGTVKTFLDAYVVDVTAFFTNYNTLKTGFDTYQTARATCLTAAAKAEVAGNCLACDTAYQTKGADTATPPVLTYATAFLTSLRDACYPYFVASQTQTDILRLANFAAPVATYTENVLKLADSDDTNDAAAVTAINAAIPAASTTGISKVPASCDANACTWITTDLLPSLKLDQTKAILGGAVPTRRMLQSHNPGRMLTGNFGSATTLADEPKIAVTVKPNPGGVSNVNDLSALRVGVVSCIVAFFVALLI